MFSEEIDNASFQSAFQKLNEDDQIDGIIVMRPLPKQISEEETIRNLNPEKDMDCETERCRARLYEGGGDFLPCTAEAVILMLKHYCIPLAGKHMVVIGRSLRAGKPLIPLGVAMKLPKGYEAYVVSRSSTFKNFGVIQANAFGIVDETYCGDDDQWYYPAYAVRDTVIHVNDRICQFRI